MDRQADLPSYKVAKLQPILNFRGDPNLIDVKPQANFLMKLIHRLPDSYF